MELNAEQKEAVTYTGDARNVLVTAGAGCGKTRTIIARAAHLYTRGTDSSRMLIMTFTNRAAREIKLRLKSEIGVASQQMQAGTFHAFCLKVMTKLPNSFGISGLSIIDSEDQNSLMGLIRKNYFKQKGKVGKGFPKTKALLTFYSYSRNTCRSPKEYMVSQSDLEPDTIESCGELFDEYQRAKEARGYLDYDDLLMSFSTALKNKPKLRHAVCNLFDEVLVDEMQDTNPIQFEILKHFSDEEIRLFCVGDPAQSIYRFRGAEFKHVYQFQEIFGSSITIPLSLNYRSYQEILDLSNWLLDRSPLDYKNRLTAHRGTCGYIPKIEEFEHHSEEASWIADLIVERNEAEVPLSDFMILYRSSYDAKTLEAELIRREIPYRFIGGTILTKSAHVRDVLSLLRLVRNTKDDLAWLRFLQLWPRIGEKSAEKIFDALVMLSTNELIRAKLEEILGADHQAVVAFSAASDQYDSPKNCLNAVTKALNPALRDRYDNWKQRSKDLELLIKVSENYQNTADFIDDFTLEPLNDTEISKRSSDAAVTLITVHSAKGTEAPICIVAGATQSNYPHFRSLGDLDAEEEERRVLYVAMTRAQNELIITRSSFHRNAFWVKSSPAVGENYFLEEVPKELLAPTLHGWTPGDMSGLGALEDIF